jgi:purine nucleoside phosphorylase
VTDHINLLGDDPVRRVAAQDREPAFPDLQDAYEPAWVGAWQDAARELGCGLRGGVLAALSGPCYETPAEVRMLRVLGADLVSMSVVPETIMARYLGMNVAAVACISNRGAGLGGTDTIRHDRVLDVVAHAVVSNRALLEAGISRSLGAPSS